MSTASHSYPRYSIADYEQWEGDWELWDGHAIAMTPAPNIRHQRTAARLLIALNQQLQNNDECHCEVLHEVDWRIKEDTVVRPDLVVVCERIETDWLVNPPTLVVEILSPSTRENDLGHKRKRYEKCGVAHYFIVDPKTESIEPLRLIQGVYRPTELANLELHEGCVLSLDTESIWA